MGGQRWRAAALSGLLLAAFLAAQALPAESAAPRVEALMQLLERHVFERFRGTAFAPHVSLGSPALFRKALEWARAIEVDPEYCRQKGCQGRAERVAVYWGELYLDTDPASVPAAHQREYATTAWHETMHLIEYQNGDEYRTDDWNERHTFYFEAMLTDVLAPLADLERAARTGTEGDEVLRVRWRRIKERFEEGAGRLNRTYPVPKDLAQFRQWSGCFVDLAAVEQAYREGQGGVRMRRIVTLDPKVTNLVMGSLQVVPQPRGPGWTETRYGALVPFDVIADPGCTWTGPVSWRARISGPKGPPDLNLDGEWVNQKAGPGQGSFLIALPDTAAAGTYTVRVTLAAQGHTRAKDVTFPHSPPAATPAPRPSPSASAAAWVPLPAPPSPPPPATALQVSLSAPAETAVGREVTITPRVAGGVPPYRYQWTTSEGKILDTEILRGRFHHSGRRTVTLRVWDRDRHATTPCTASASVQVHPRLEAWVEGPTEVEPGRPFTLQARARGGKPVLDYRWTAASGQTRAGPTVHGSPRAAGSPPLRIVLRVQDALDPPQEVEVATTVAFRGAKALQTPGGRAGEATLEGRYLGVFRDDNWILEFRLEPGGTGTAATWTNLVTRAAEAFSRVRPIPEGPAPPEDSEASPEFEPWLCPVCDRHPHPITWSLRDGVLTLRWSAGGACTSDFRLSGPIRRTGQGFTLVGTPFAHGETARPFTVDFTRVR